MIKKIISFLLVITFILSCNESGTGPIDNTEPGRRNYVWEEDTIKVPSGYYTDLSRIWGNTPSDVWVCGFADISDYTIWHYDSLEWKSYNVNGYINPNGIYGFRENSFWIGTTHSEIWYWNGIELSKYQTMQLPGYEYVITQSIWGSSASDIYAIGFAENISEYSVRGIIMKYNGSNWDFHSASEDSLTFLEIKQQKSSGLYFLNSYSLLGADNPYILFAMDGNRLERIYEGEKYITLTEINGEVYFTQDKKILKYSDGTLQLWKDLSDTEFKGGMWGRSENDFFTVNNDGIGHYNGTDLFTVYPTDYGFENMFLFDFDIFFLFRDNSIGQNIIVHGHLE